MRHIIPLLVIFLAAIALAAILLPADPWSNNFPFRMAAILIIGIPCYFYGISNGKAVIGAARRRPWLQYSLRTLLLVTTLVAISLGLYCGRVREQRRAVDVLDRIEGCEVNYDNDPGPLMPINKPSRLEAWLNSVLGVDFLYGAVQVSIRASDVEHALPQLKQLPYLQSVCVDPDVEAVTSGDETEAALKKAEIERERIRANTIERLKIELPHIRIENPRPFVLGPTPVVG